MPGSSLGGFTEGLWSSIAEGRARTAKEEEARAKREADILTTLASADDPEIRSMAIAGMLEMANPKRRAKGLRGFLGEMEASATLPKIRELLGTPVATAVRTPAQATRSVPVDVAMRAPGSPPTPGQTPVAPPPGRPTSASMPQGSLVTPPPSGASPAPAGPPQSAFSARGPLLQARRRTELRPRQAFLPPEERMRRDTIAREQAEVEGEVEGYIAAGMTRQEAVDLVKQSRIRRAGGGMGTARMIPGMANGQKVFGVWDPVSQRVLDPDTRQPIPDFAPATSGDLGDAFEIAAREEGFANGAAVPAEAMPRVRATAAKYAQELNYARGTGTGQAAGERPLTLDQQLAHTRAMQGTWFRLNQPVLATRRQVASLDAGMAAVDRGDIAAGSEAVIVTFEKILDALSVVRESEYLRPLQNQSLYDRVTGALQRLREGGAGIPPEQLKGYARLAKEIAADVEASVAPARDMLRQTAVAYKLDPNLIVGPTEGMTGAPPPGPGTTPAATPTPGTAPAAPAAPAGDKTATLREVEGFARAKGQPVDVIRRQLEAQGYRIVDAQ